MNVGVAARLIRAGTTKRYGTLMDELELLSDDRSLLSSQVVHLAAMLRNLVEGDFETGPLQ